jgi:hypothetical protein
MNPLTGILIALINPTALPVLRTAGALFIGVNLLAGAWVWHRRQQLFGRDSNAPGDRPAVRYLQVIVLGIPWLFITFRLVYLWAAL